MKSKVSTTPCSNHQIDGEYFVIFSYLLRKHELYLKKIFLGKRRIRPLMNYYLCSPHLLNQIGLNEINWIKVDKTQWIEPYQTRSNRFITIHCTYPCSNCTLCVYEITLSKLKLLIDQVKFIYSKKATNCSETFTLLLTGSST